MTPFYIKSQQILCRLADVEPDSLQRWAHLVGMLAGLAINPCTWRTSTVRTGADEAVTHATQRFLSFQQFFIQFPDYRFHQVVGCFERQTSLAGCYLDSYDSDPVIASDRIEKEWQCTP